jgi:hypothetical protein
MAKRLANAAAAPERLRIAILHLRSADRPAETICGLGEIALTGSHRMARAHETLDLCVTCRQLRALDLAR